MVLRIADQFSSCRSLDGKPKIFIVQSCQNVGDFMVQSPIVQEESTLSKGLLMQPSLEPQQQQQEIEDRRYEYPNYGTPGSELIAITCEHGIPEVDAKRWPQNPKAVPSCEVPDSDKESQTNSLLMPTCPDVFMCYSTLPGHLSNRDPVKGTLYIQSLVKRLSEVTDLVTALHHVISDVKEQVAAAKERGDNVDDSQCPFFFHSTVHRSVFLAGTRIT
jgi:hypothetical protein